ncbi:MAG: hypothetical protein LBR89_00055 [Holosporales bacterium]|jgi:hypothetical protein|nr:hypothetical protein [Holosporales bacterium]
MPIYKLLSQKFCHDIASPLNVLGLVINAQKIDNDDLSHAQQSYEYMVSLLNMYRALSARSPQANAIEKAMSIVRELCNYKRVKYGACVDSAPDSGVPYLIDDSTLPCSIETEADIGKVLCCIYWAAASHLCANDSFVVKQRSQRCFEIQLTTAKEIHGDKILMPRAASGEGEPSGDAPLYLLKALLDKHSATIDVTATPDEKVHTIVVKL